MKSKISLVTLGVRDFQRSLTFYREGLGLKPYKYTGDQDHVMFEMEGSWLSLYPREKLAQDAGVPDNGLGFPGITLAHNVPSQAEVRTAFDQAVKAGATAIKPPQDVFWGGYHAYFSDPDGYLWEIAYNPFTDLT